MRTSRLMVLAAGVLAAACSAAAQNPPTTAPAPARQADPAARRPPKVDISKLRFMAGCWAARVDKDNDAEETWTMPSDNLLLSTTKYLSKDFATGYDFNRIEVTDSGVVLGILAKGRPEDVYLMKTLVDEYVMFENLKKPFPQRVIYRMA